MKRMSFAIVLILELIILLLFQDHLGHALPVELNVFTGSIVMSANYSDGILFPAMLLLMGIHVAAFGLQALANVFQQRAATFAELDAKLLHVFSVYLEGFSIILMFYLFKFALKGILLMMLSYACLAVVLLELGLAFKAMHSGQRN